MKDHPAAPKGTSLEVCVRSDSEIVLDGIGKELDHYVRIPTKVKDQWLEEVKEEPTCSKEFADRMKARLQEMSNIGEKDVVIWRKWLVCWIDEHTSTEE